MEWIKKHVGFTIIGSLALIAILLVTGAMQYRISITNEGERYQERVELAYQNARNSLSTCIDKGRIAAQVTEQEFDAIRGILVDTASARYTDGNEEYTETEASVALGTGSAFSAIIENYPSIDQRSWQSLQATVVGCREEFQGAQNALFYRANELDDWRVNDSLFSQEIKNNFPTDELEVLDTRTGETLTAQAALTYLTRVIEVEEARTAYETGTLEEQELFE